MIRPPPAAVVISVRLSPEVLDANATGHSASRALREEQRIESELSLRRQVAEGSSAMIAYDSTSFSAGQDTGVRVAACVARLAAHELIDDSRWWNRRRHRLMAKALVACADEMESAADAGWQPDVTAAMEAESVFRPALVGGAG